MFRHTFFTVQFYMTPEHRRQLAELIEKNKESIIDAWREGLRPLLSARDLSAPQLINKLPIFLDEIADRIRDIDRPYSWMEGMQTEHEVETTAAEHGKQRFHIGFDVVEIVKEYGILREIIIDLAERENVLIAGLGGKIFHFTFNKATAAAAAAYQAEKEAELRQRRKEYLSFVMHDLKTPLNAITVAAHVIEEQTDDPKLVAEMNGIILRSADELNELLQQTIKLQKTTSMEETEQLMPRKLELWPLVQAVIEEFHVIVSVDRTSIHNLIPSALTICVDADALKSILRNVLSNSIKYTPGGKVVIGISRSRQDSIDIWIRDNGTGMTPERLHTLFKRVQPDPVHQESTGLGLFMVKKLVDAHGGKVSAESTLGEGTTIRITLPIDGK